MEDRLEEVIELFLPLLNSKYMKLFNFNKDFLDNLSHFHILFLFEGHKLNLLFAFLLNFMEVLEVICRRLLGKATKNWLIVI